MARKAPDEIYQFGIPLHHASSALSEACGGQGREELRGVFNLEVPELRRLVALLPPESFLQLLRAEPLFL